MKQDIKIYRDEDGHLIALSVGNEEYVWLPAQLPDVITALRACAGGEVTIGADGMVFMYKDKVALTDQESEISYLMPPYSALEMADDLQEVYDQVA
jgi:hypothetical protein